MNEHQINFFLGKINIKISTHIITVNNSVFIYFSIIFIKKIIHIICILVSVGNIIWWKRVSPLAKSLVIAHDFI